MKNLEHRLVFGRRISLLGRISQADRQEAAVLSELDLSSNAVDSSSRGMPRCPPIVTPLEGQRKGYHMEEAGHL